ncbi:STAS domain-containing protein [Steroidobacter sp.]|uniref:STAS domain-containing protein n=1 Tax=Steroidobacter sp. TaxID=1978227 RepID=UPI001A615648|nr:STAS domain-containing protein [Steroidobacter sp.]MBL8270368.1 STAS domain-containing protein [Steroidobacter sp.]
MSEAAATCREGRLQIAGELTIYAAAALKEELFGLLPEVSGDVEIDLSAVSALDTAGLQILLMVRRLALARGAAFRVLNPSVATVEMLELCGMRKLLDDAALEQAS